MVLFPDSGWSVRGWARVQQVMLKSTYDYSGEFLTWLSRNPEIWRRFANKALAAQAGGHKQRFGAKAILEILRWESFVADADKTFKINNNYAPDLARLIMDCKPELRGYFKIRGSAYRGDAPK